MRACLSTLWLILMTGHAADVFAADSVSTPDAAAEQGRRVYEAQSCRRCHALAGKGNPRYPLDGVGKRLDAAALRQAITAADAEARKLNARALAAKRRFASLPERDLDALIAYLRASAQ